MWVSARSCEYRERFLTATRDLSRELSSSVCGIASECKGNGHCARSFHGSHIRQRFWRNLPGFVQNLG